MMRRTRTRTDFFGPDQHVIVSAVMFVFATIIVAVGRTSSEKTSGRTSSETNNRRGEEEEEQQQDR